MTAGTTDELRTSLRPPSVHARGRTGAKGTHYRNGTQKRAEGRSDRHWFDISLTRTGIALWRDGHMTTTSTVSQPIGAQSWDERNTRIVGQAGLDHPVAVAQRLDRRAAVCRPAVIEAPHPARPANGLVLRSLGSVARRLQQVAIERLAHPRGGGECRDAQSLGDGKRQRGQGDDAARRTPRVARNNEPRRERIPPGLRRWGYAKLSHEPVEMTAWRVSGLAKGIGREHVHVPGMSGPRSTAVVTTRLAASATCRDLGSNRG